MCNTLTQIYSIVPTMSFFSWSRIQSRILHSICLSYPLSPFIWNSFSTFFFLLQPWHFSGIQASYFVVFSSFRVHTFEVSPFQRIMLTVTRCQFVPLVMILHLIIIKVVSTRIFHIKLFFPLKLITKLWWACTPLEGALEEDENSLWLLSCGYYPVCRAATCYRYVHAF